MVLEADGYVIYGLFEISQKELCSQTKARIIPSLYSIKQEHLTVAFFFF